MVHINRSMYWYRMMAVILVWIGQKHCTVAGAAFGLSHSPLSRRRRTARHQEPPPSSSSPSSSSSLSSPTTKLGQKQGVYVRPSAAIERGSGFFVPGLEGPKVRLLFGSLLLALTFVNHQQAISSSSSSNEWTTSTSVGNVASECLAAFFALLVLFQGTVEYLKTQGGFTAFNPTTRHTSRDSTNHVVTVPNSKQMTTVSTYQQQWIIRGIDDTEWKDNVEWAASTYMVLTPATHMLLASREGIVFAVQRSNDNNSNHNNNGENLLQWQVTPQVVTGCTTALHTLAQSQSGRVSLPMQHPAVIDLGLGKDSENDYNNNINNDSTTTGWGTTRCIVLQRVNPDLCWIMASDQLLVAFTKQDLQWLGQLATYIDR